MVTTLRKTKEKGQRTPRSMDIYQEKGGVKGTAYCECGVVFRNKRWQSGENEDKSPGGQSLVCPACRRIADRVPAGIVALRGDFYAAHEAEIDNLIKNTEQAAVTKNPLGRVMETSREQGGVTITTTDGRLAQKIGREVYKSHGGELHFNWSQAEDLVRVSWSR